MTPINLKTETDVVKTEGPNRYSRVEAIIVSGSGVLQVGAVLGRVTASGKYKPVTPAASDGSERAVAVLLQRADATSADFGHAVILARHAEVVAQALVYPAGVNATQQAAAIEHLKAAGIVARRAV